MHPLLENEGIYPITVDGKWCVHSYYTMCPYAPDNSGRLLVSGVDLKTLETCIMVLSPEHKILNTFGFGKAESDFYHTGSWQTWSPDAKFVYYRSGSMKEPFICRYELESGNEIKMSGDMEGAPPFGEPVISGLIGMIYAAGYGKGKYLPDEAPVPFESRDKHGLFRYDVQNGKRELAISVDEVYKLHPHYEKIRKAEREYIKEYNNGGFTLMTYCVRWSADGERLLFYFGNHVVDRARKEPKLSYVFTAKKDLTDIHLAVDMSFDKSGVHWGWHPDGKHLIGYATHPDNDNKTCLCQVNYDGTDFKIISKHHSGGHPSISPIDYNLLVTDEPRAPGRVVFIDLTTDTEIGSYTLPRTHGGNFPGRNPHFVCHHPVFRQDGKKVLVNALPDENSILCELDVIERR